MGALLMVLVVNLAVVGCGGFLIGGVDVVRGSYHAWWAPVPLPRQLISSALAGFPLSLDKINTTGLVEGDHLVVFEMGRETDCGPIFPAILREDFMEFKFEIPFLKHVDVSRDFDYKEVIYVDSEVESMGARVGYKLNSSVAKIAMNSSQYSVKKGDILLEAFFVADGKWGTTKTYPNFGLLEQIFSQRWFGSPDFHTCADHHYDFSQAQVRPAKTKLRVDHNLLNSWFPDSVFHLPGINKPLGVAEVFINWTMTAPFSCRDK